MGKLFDAVKKVYNELSDFQMKQDANFIEETTFTNLYNAHPKELRLNFFFNEIQSEPDYYFNSEESFKNFIEQNRELFPGNSAAIPMASLNYNTGIIDVQGIQYEKMLDALESKIDAAKVDELIERYEKYQLPKPIENHPFKKITTSIVNELDELKLNENQINDYTEALNYINDQFITLKNKFDVNDMVDLISLNRDKEAKSHIKTYANEIGADGEKLESMKDNWNSLNFNSNDTSKKMALSPFVQPENEPVYSEEFKNKVLELDKLITEKGLIPDGAVGETPYKDYGFIDYYTKAFEIKESLLNYSKLTDENEKKDTLQEILTKTNELKDVKNKYNDVMDYIKQNFDLSKVGLNGNIYSGRILDTSNKLEEYRPNLPKEWDFENAGYGIILNGFAQLKGAAKLAGVSIEEYMNNPNKALLQGAKNVVKDIDSKYILPTKDNDGNDISLGKRIAHIAVMDSDAYSRPLDVYSKSTRATEFLNNASEYDENTSKNIISTAAANALISMYDHSSSALFYDKGRPDYESLQNLFLVGDDAENLMELSKNYFRDDATKPNLDEIYKLKMDVKKNVNAVNETRRVMATLKDYLKERYKMYVDRRNDPEAKVALEDELEPAVLFVAAKNYMNDFIYNNNIDLLNYDKKQRNEVMEFLNNPLQAFVNKYIDEPNLLRTDSEGKLIDTFDGINSSFKREFDRLHKKAGDKFVQSFDDLNKQTKGRNAGKSISQILNDNKGGYFERKFDSSSREYKALVSSIDAATDPGSPTYGDLNGVKLYAQKYVDHKLPEGANFDKLSENEKRRVEFCHTIIGAIAQMEFSKKMEDSKIKLAPDIEQFQQKVKMDVDDPVAENIVENVDEVANENIMTQ